MKVKFLKERFYRNKKYKKNDTIDMSEIDVKAYLECHIVEIATKNKTSKPLEALSYRNLQRKCKAKGIPAVGTKQDLVVSLTECE
jgi:hypothetical protein